MSKVWWHFILIQKYPKENGSNIKDGPFEETYAHDEYIDTTNCEQTRRVWGT